MGDRKESWAERLRRGIEAEDLHVRGLARSAVAKREMEYAALRHWESCVDRVDGLLRTMEAEADYAAGRAEGILTEARGALADAWSALRRARDGAWRAEAAHLAARVVRARRVEELRSASPR